jgi:hypothetical protein
MIEQVVIDYPGGRAVHVGQVEEASRDLELILPDAWPLRPGRAARHVRGVSKISGFRCLPARKRNTPLGTVTSSIHEDLSGRRTR